MSKFILVSIIIVLFLVNKLFFLKLEKEYAQSLPATVESGVIVLTFCISVIFYVKKSIADLRNAKKRKTIKARVDLISIGLITSIILVLILTFRVNIRKISLHWDAIALYDARALFLKDGMKFSDMPALSKYDDQNKYYYLLYPPYTSIGHYYWRSINFLENIPVSVYYSVYLTFLALIIILTTKEHLGLKWSLLLTLITISNFNIFNITIKEYTNLPFTLHIVGGVFLLSSYFSTRSKWELLSGIILVSTSLWIRLLEPIWVIVGIALGVSLFTSKYKINYLWPCFLLFLFGLIQYLSWVYFTKNIAHNPGFISYSPLKMIEPFIALFTGAPFIVIPTILRTWGLSFLIHFFTIIALIVRYKSIIKNKSILFLGLVVLLSIVLYLTEFYLLSFQYDWWSIVAKSLDRSAAFLFPISAYIFIWIISSSKGFIKKH